MLLQLESLLGKSVSSIYEGNASALRVLSVVGAEGFQLRNRALHVYSEAGRVYAFRDVCKVRGVQEDMAGATTKSCQLCLHHVACLSWV